MKPIWPAGRNTTTPAQLGLFGAFDCDPGPAWTPGTVTFKLSLSELVTIPDMDQSFSGPVR